MIESTLVRLQGWRVGSEEDANDEHLRAGEGSRCFLALHRDGNGVAGDCACAANRRRRVRRSNREQLQPGVIWSRGHHGGAGWGAVVYGIEGQKVGRITTAGAITEYPVPSPKSGGGPAGITVGPDGALWFTEPDAIGRITTVGEVTEFSVPAPNGGPSQITSRFAKGALVLDLVTTLGRLGVKRIGY